MKYVIFGNSALCWMMAFYLKSISPNILTFIIGSKDDEKYVSINKSIIDRLKFFGIDQKDFFLGCLWSEENYSERSNVITLDDLLETSDISYTLDTEKTTKYFQEKCEEVFRRWNPDGKNIIVDRVHKVNAHLLETVYASDGVIEHLKLSENSVVRADIFIDVRQ